MAPWPLARVGPVLACPICGSDATLFGHKDVNLGGDPGLKPRAPSGQDLSYHRCSACGHLFCAQLSGWAPADYTRHIYNAAYIEVDPDYEARRPQANAQWLLSQLPRSGPQGAPLRVLDYGAGSGLLARLLAASDLDAHAEDPFTGAALAADVPPFDVVCAFEVVEHSNDPIATLRAMQSRLKPGGLMVLSTLLQPPNIGEIGLHWWYAMPRNGHISLFSAPSLQLALKTIGVQRMQSVSEGLHLAWA
jgi:SAM-dependent methyltransferase